MVFFGSLAIEIIALFGFLFFALYFYFTRNFNFWMKRGVPYVKPLPFLGSLKDVVLQKLSIGHQLKKVYEDFKNEPYVGIISIDQPALVIRDLDLIKNILVKDSQNFMDHLFESNESVNPLVARGLAVSNGQKWKHMRHNLSSTFTSGKMKNMFYLVDKCAKELDDYLDERCTGGSPVEIKESASKFTTDVIASCAFGIDSNTLKDSKAEFRKHLGALFVFTPLRALATALSFFAPKMLNVFRIPIIPAEVNDFVRKTLWDTAKYRDENGITRRDFVDNLMELKRKNEVENVSATAEDAQKSNFKFVDDDYAAQALSFLTAGFETSSSTISYTVYQMALNPHIQQRLRTEIRKVLQKNNNQVTYEAIQEMKYLDMVVNETLRLYPVLPFLDRKCTADYKLPAPSGKGSITVPAGTGVYVSLLGIHYDPGYFPDPEKYDPERFTDENKQSRPAYTHMPFGEGPRTCIGMRFGLMETKTGLIHILSRYEVSPCKDTPIPLVFDTRNFLLGTTTGIPLTFKRIHT